MKKILFAICIIISQLSFSQWEKVNKGIGDNTLVLSLAYSGNTIIVGTMNKGFYISTNYGTSWRQINYLRDSSVYALVANGNSFFAGAAFCGRDGCGVHRSTDAGKTWARLELNDKSIISLAVYGDTLFAGTNGRFGIYRSTDNGTNWTQTSMSKIDVRSFTKSGNIIFAGTGLDSGVYKSTNNGTNWTKTSLNNRTIISLVTSGKYIFAGASDNNGVYVSTNNGDNWTQTSLNDRSVNSLALYGSNIFAGTPNKGVYVSTICGEDWTQRNEGLGVNPDITALLVVNDILFAGTYKGVYKRTLCSGPFKN